MGYRGRLEAQARARQLRAEGWTMPEIAEELGVARSSVSKWTQDVPYVPRRPRGRPIRRGPNKLQRAKAAEIAEMDRRGAETIGVLSDREVLLAGLGLYAGDGAKAGSQVRFANSHPEMIRTIRRNKHEHGCCHVRYACTRAHREIMGLMGALLASEPIPG